MNSKLYNCLAWAAMALMVACSSSSSTGNKERQAFENECGRMKSAISDMDRAISSQEVYPASYYENILSGLSCESVNMEGVKQSSIDSLRRVSEEAQERFCRQMGFKWMRLHNEDETLMTAGKHVFAFRLYKGDEIRVKVASSEMVKSVTVVDQRTDSELIGEKMSKEFDMRGKIRFSSIYLVSIDLTKQGYVELQVMRKSDNREHLFSKTSVNVTSVECAKGDKGAVAKNEVSMEPLYDEPFKATLASQGRAIFGNKDRTMASVQLPKGSTGFFYRLRLSSSKDSDHDDGRLGSELIGFSSSRDLGPISYSHKMSLNSPFVENALSYLSSPKCEEEIYCNFYVIKGAKEARKFQDTGSNFVYNLDNSRQNTQSVNGFVPSEGLTSFYLGLSNSRFTTSIYVWLEVVAVVPVTKYYREVYE